MLNPDIVDQSKNAVLQGISSQEAMEALKVKSAEITSEFLSWLKSATETAGDFFAKETPKFVQEFLTWNFAQSTIYASASFLGIILALIIAKIVYKKISNHNFTFSGDKTGATLVTTIVSVIIIGFLGSQVLIRGMEAVKIKVAPRVYLVDWLSLKLTGQEATSQNSSKTLR